MMAYNFDRLLTFQEFILLLSINSIYTCFMVFILFSWASMCFKSFVVFFKQYILWAFQEEYVI